MTLLIDVALVAACLGLIWWVSCGHRNFCERCARRAEHSGQRGTAGPTTTEPPVDQTTSGS